MIVEPILLVVDPVHCQEDAEPADVDLPMFGLHAGYIVIGDHCLVH